MSKALEILKTINRRYCTDSVCGKLDLAIAELEALETKDRLAELEKVILNYYLVKGYGVGIGGCEFKVNISTYSKDKEIQIMFRKDRSFNYETVFRKWEETTKEMWDKAFEYFTIKDK